MSDALDTEVQHRLDTDRQYPLGESDPMKWAVAFRLIAARRGIQLPPEVDDGLMVGWFANAMVSAEMHATGGSFLNADGMQAIIDGEIDPHPEFCR